MKTKSWILLAINSCLLAYQGLRVRPRHWLWLFSILFLPVTSFGTSLSLLGNAYYTVSGDTVVLQADTINNNDTGGSGTISLELWAFRYAYPKTTVGYKLASYVASPYGLAGGYSINNISSGSIPFTPPPPGTWYLSVLAREYTAISGDGYTTRDWLNFTSPVRVAGGANWKDIQIIGNANWQVLVGDYVALNVDQIKNSCNYGTSASLRLDLWATKSPISSGNFTGYRFASIDLDPLSAGYTYYNLNRYASYVQPPNGAYYVTMILWEYNNGKYAMVDSLNFQTRLIVNNPTSPITIITSPLTGGIISGVTNGQKLEINQIYTVTAKSNGMAGFVFRGWAQTINGIDWVTTNAPALTFTMQSNMVLAAVFTDVRKPTLAITNPVISSRWSNDTVNVMGWAKDNDRVSRVWVSLGTANFMPATTQNNWTNWTFLQQGLTPGTNQVRAYAVDATGNFSQAVTSQVVYVIGDRLTLFGNGIGTISPNYSNVWLEIGKTYTLTAKPYAGQVFSNWVGGTGTLNVLTNGTCLKFVMQSNYVLNANFIPNPFLPAIGSYQGLFYSTNADHFSLENMGFVSGTVSSSGGFSARLQIGNVTHSLSGQFAPNGMFSTYIPRRGLNPIYIQLKLDLAAYDTITGDLSDGTWRSQLVAYRSRYSKINPAPQTGKFTLVFSGSKNPSVEPGGYGFGAFAVDSSGNVNLGGTLGDGTKIVARTFVSKNGQWPLYSSLYSGGGAILGWMRCTNGIDRDLDGTANWVKAAQFSSKLYPRGFSNSIEVVGSTYSFANGDRALNLTNGFIVLENGCLPFGITNAFTLGNNNKFVGTNKLSVSIIPASGLLQGTVMNPATGKGIPISGTLLQKQNLGYGFFLGTDQSGSVVLESE